MFGFKGAIGYIIVSHRVQFYNESSYLIEEVAEFISTGLLRGDGALVVATDAHREAIEERLEEKGLNPLAVRRLLLTFPADKILARFMVMGVPDPQLFRKMIGRLITQATPPGKKLRIFGEMVALLWEDGNRVAALQLEKLWNELALDHSFSLLCGYHLDGFRGETNATPFRSICDAHDEVIPSERCATRGSSSQWLRYVAVLEQKSL